MNSPSAAGWTGSRSKVGRAREQARKTLPGWGLGEHADLTELIVSELVTNAMVHGDGQIEVRLSCAARGDLWVEFRDDGAGRPVRQRPGTDDEWGRGLALIEGLIEPYGGARGVEEDRNGPGKTVFVAVPLGGAEQQAAGDCGWPARTRASESATRRRHELTVDELAE